MFEVAFLSCSAANLLLDYTAQRMKLADFGAAELLEEKRLPGDHFHGDVGAGTLAYNPPEVRGGKEGGRRERGSSINTVVLYTLKKS